LAAVAPVIQPASEFAPRQCKEIQGKFLAFPWIPLAESGLFNGLQRKNKKTSAGQNSRLGLYFALTDRRLKTVIFFMNKVYSIVPNVNKLNC
jgi:hypothetical protein